MGGFKDGSGTMLIGGMALTVCLSGPAPLFSCDTQLNPRAFESLTFTQNTLLPNGMMAIRYPEIDDEALPHVSVHRVIRTLPGLHEHLPELDDGDYRIVEVDGTVGWMTYLLSAHALFYGVGEDALGLPQKTWIDPEEDGINGNEHLHGVLGN